MSTCSDCVVGRKGGGAKTTAAYNLAGALVAFGAAASSSTSTVRPA